MSYDKRLSKGANNTLAGSINSLFFRKLLPSISIFWAAVVFVIIFVTVDSSEFWDFNVFYSSAKNALAGQNIYTLYGDKGLPFWYFPWTSWMFIPFALFSFETAKYLFVLVNLLSLFFVIRYFQKYLNITYSFSTNIFFYTSSIFISWLLFKVGQSDFILLGFITLVMLLIDSGREAYAGIIFPVLFFKPHLIVVFIIYSLYKGGKRFFFGLFLSLVCLLLVSFMQQRSWPYDMINIIKISGKRTDNAWDFITLSEMIGINQNWAGSNYLLLSIGLILFSGLIVWRYRELGVVPLLILATSASMLSAPRAYTYNLPLIIPAIIWVSDNRPKLITFLMIIFILIAFLSNFSTWSYLIVLIVFIITVFHAEKFNAHIEDKNE